MPLTFSGVSDESKRVHIGSRYESDGTICLFSLLANAHLVKMTQGSSFATGLEVSDKRRRVITISTGSKAVDAILGGVYKTHTRRKC